ncbi:MAG: MoaD/ThiS family protein [Bdellovibrionota bacterium]
MATVWIPSSLHSYTDKKSKTVASGRTVDEATHDLDRQYPGIRFRFVDEQDSIRPHIKIFLNREQIHDLSVGIQSNDEIAIVQAFSGG